MPISWNEIRHNAVAFAKEWASETREDAEAKSFWDEFFQVFGIRRRTVASFEEPVKKLSGNWGYIDLFWPGTLLVEHKSLGKPLDAAQSQAMEYIRGLKNAGRDDDIPRYIVLSDFGRIALHDLDEGTSIEFPLHDLHKQVQAFAFIPGYRQHRLDVEDPINVKAVVKMGELHDALEDGGYSGPNLERFLVRILFCLFAEDNGIFDRNAFTQFIEEQTRPDGSDLGAHLARIFSVLNTPVERRQKNLDELIAGMPYVNGDLFSENLGFVEFTRSTRDALVRCCRFDWSRISPAVFGSLFQSVMEPRERRQVGAHYTSERDILKVVRSLFLDDLRAEFGRAKKNKAELRRFQERLGKLKFFDPACGCGNFLVVTYRELRLLELDVLVAIKSDDGQLALDIAHMTVVDVDAFHGIEINEFPVRIAELAMWLMDHQMNLRLSEAFGQYFVRLPLKKSAKIVHANALRTDWNTVLPSEECSYVLGNPPFVGKAFATEDQKADLSEVWSGVKGAGVLDFVTGWYRKAAEYIQGTRIKVGLVSTNSITQGEQVGLLWTQLFSKYGVKIHFGHRTFAWISEARGKAHVHVVIIGFAAFDGDRKLIYDYEIDEEHPTVSKVSNISPYLVEGSDCVVVNRSRPLCKVPELAFGSMPNDGGYLMLTDDERETLIKTASKAEKFIRPILGSREFINNIKRWCLWLKDAKPEEIRSIAEVKERVAGVRKHRAASGRETTQGLANTPALFGEDRQPKARYLAIPKTSSERRRYIPMAFLEADVVANTELFTCPSAGVYEFGVLSSAMHVAWVRQVCGRLKSDYRYSNKLVYNNYPWPDAPTEKQRRSVEEKANAVLAARAEFPDSSLADLYDPLTMPAQLAKAHAELDRAVDLCYRPQQFGTDLQRVEYLFGLYEKLTAPLTAAINRRPPRKKRPT